MQRRVTMSTVSEETIARLTGASGPSEGAGTYDALFTKYFPTGS
jgi:hypothetical protein